MYTESTLIHINEQTVHLLNCGEMNIGVVKTNLEFLLEAFTCVVFTSPIFSNISVDIKPVMWS